MQDLYNSIGAIPTDAKYIKGETISGKYINFQVEEELEKTGYRLINEKGVVLLGPGVGSPAEIISGQRLPKLSAETSTALKNMQNLLAKLKYRVIDNKRQIIAGYGM